MKKMPMLRKRMQQQQSPTTAATTAVATRGRVVFGPMVLWVAIVLSFLLLLSAPMGSLAFLPSAQNNKYNYNYKYKYNYETNGRNDRHTIPRHATAESDSDASTIIEEDSESTSTSSTTTTPSTSTTTTRGRRRSAFRANVKRLLFSPGSSSSSNNNKSEASPSIATPSSFSQQQIQQQQSIIDAAFAPAENALDELEASLTNAREALRTAKAEALLATERLQSQSQSATTTTTTTAASTTDDEELDFSDTYTDLSSLTFDDIDYESSEMAPPFLDPNSCLLPDAEPVVRVEKAPENSRRIFAGIDILASADDVWNVLTNYAELQNVIPNLVVNDVLALYDEEEEEGTSASTDDDNDDESLPEAVRCERLSKTRKGSLLRQVGGAKVAGIRFSATTTLEVREWPNGLPDFAHFADDVWEGRSREARARDLYSTRTPLQRYRFPRPFCISELPTRDISMQSTEDDDGEFRLYQGVWRMQPLVGCSPPGQHAMRLTYAVEISPRPYLPVRLVEGRIVKDLCSNLEAIRAAVTAAAGNNKE